MSRALPAATIVASARPTASSSARSGAASSGIQRDRVRLAEQLLHREQRRQTGRDARDDRLRTGLGALDLLPVGDHFVRAGDTDVAEHVRMTAHELVVDAARDVGDGERAGFGREHRLDHDLEQEVAELVLERVVAASMSTSPPGASGGSASIASTTS